MIWVCIASGPSLTAEDCELVRQSGHPTIVTNTTFRMCPWAQILFGFDLKWWKVYHEEVRSFAGRKLSCSYVATKYGAEVYAGGRAYRNSGACAVSVAMAEGASKVVLLGFDAGIWKDRTHWHHDHPAGLSNIESLPMWGQQFERLAKDARRRGVSIVNASRRTRLECFPRMPLEEAL